MPEHRQGRAIWSIRTSLALLALACILPGALMSTYFIFSDYQRQKSRAVADAIATARAAAANLDRDISSIESGLKVLATSNALDHDDLAAFYRQAKDALPYQGITNYVLMDVRGRQKLNTIKPYGEPLPVTGAPPQLQAIFDKGATVLTDLFIGPATGKPIFAIGVPVVRHDQIMYSLNAGMFPDRVAALLKAQRLPPGWIGAVLDSQGTVVARSHEMARFVGHPAVPDLVRLSRLQREGVMETITLEGVPVITAFSRSGMSNWSVAVGVPKASLNVGLKQSLVVLLVVNTLLSALALWVAWRLALSRVVHPTDRLLDRMSSISQGMDPGPPSTVIASREFMALEQGFTDMGQRLAQQEQERRAKAAAEAANQAKTHFLSRMSHELRTPLNAVLGFAQVLKMNKADALTERQLAMVNQIESSGHHLLAMIADVLDVAKIESNAVDLFIEDLDAHAIATECWQMVAEQASKAGVQLAPVACEGATNVRADRTRLKQVLLNLLSNAIKYNRPGGWVRLTLQGEGPQLRFQIEDNGMGMSEEQARHLFEPFNRLGRENTSTPGTGIGLVICQRLLELMGSSLSVQSVENEGSTFAFSLPTPRVPGDRQPSSTRL